MPQFTLEQIERYKRHLLLDEVGADGQRRLLDARVLIIGAGGLGSPAALYLAAAGVGTLGLLDFDRVDASNLQRQVLYGTPDVGRPKVEVARERLRALNPDVQVIAHEERLEAANARERIRGYDVVLDGTDTFPSRYLTNDVCVWERRPLVYGSIMRFEGQAAVFDATRGPCYRCLFPEPPPPELAPNCAAAGVLGVLPGVIGMLQATEVIKLLLGLGEPLIGRLLVYDALALDFRTFRISRDPECVVCGPNPKITQPIDYEAFCSASAGAHAGHAVPEITAHELALRLASADAPLLLDVREPWEHETARIPGARLLPLAGVEERVGELEAWREKPIVIHCHHGGRSRKACELLRAKGFTRVENLAGGIEAWSTQVDPSVARY